MTSREHALAPRADKALRQVQGHRLQFSSLVLLLSRRLSFTDHLTSTKRHETSIPIHSARCKGGRFHFPSSASGLGQKRRKNIRNGPFGAVSQLDSLSLPWESCWMYNVIHRINRIHSFLLGVAVNEERSGEHAIHIVVLQILACAENIPGRHYPASTCFFASAKTCHASAMPSSTAFFISGESLPASKAFPPLMLSLANRAMSSFSVGLVGQNSKMKFRTLKNSGQVRSWSRVSGLMKSIAGAVGGAGLPRNCERGCTL